MDKKIFRFILDKNEKKNGKAVYSLILNLKVKCSKDIEIQPLEEPKYSGKIVGIILSGGNESLEFAASKLVKYLEEKKVAYSEGDFVKDLSEVLIADERHKDSKLEKELKSGIAFYHLGLYEDSYQQLLKVIKQDPNNHLALQHIGLIYEGREDYTKAVDYYKKSLEAKEDLSSTHFFLGNVYQKLGSYEDALNEYKTAIRLDPEIPILYNNMAWTFYQIGDYDKAIRAFEESINLDPDLPFPYNGLGCIYQELGYLEDAVEEFSQAIELFPEYAAAHLKLGWVYYQMGDYDKAALEFNFIIEHTEDDNYILSSHYSLANTFLAQNLLEEAYEEFLQVIEIDPSFADAYFNLGVICSKLEMYDQAINYLNKCMEKKSRLKDQAHMYLAFSYTHLKKFDEAVKECELALKVEPNDPEVYSILGSIHSFKEEWESSIEAFKKSLEYNPNSARTSFNIALAYENKDDYENAVKYYKGAIAVDRNFLEAYTNLGWLYLDNNKNDEALILFERAVELKGDDAELLNNLGWAYSKITDYKNAIEQYKKALKCNPGSAVIMNNLGIASYQLKDFDAARRYFLQALDMDKEKAVSGFVHFYLGLICEEEEKLKEAIEEFNITKKLDTDNSEVYYHIGRCYDKMSLKEEACKFWEKYLELEPEGEFAVEVKEKMGSSSK
ncbi:MAG: tetratricopeptide repeat protein [Armatimonadota bacterium]